MSTKAPQTSAGTREKGEHDMKFGEFRRRCDTARYDLEIYNAEGKVDSVSLDLDYWEGRAWAMKYDGAEISRFRAGMEDVEGDRRPVLEVELNV